MYAGVQVALLTEGVDRNSNADSGISGRLPSPSSRRAWIEITKVGCVTFWFLVALLTEGVDRN